MCVVYGMAALCNSLHLTHHYAWHCHTHAHAWACSELHESCQHMHSKSRQLHADMCTDLERPCNIECVGYTNAPRGWLGPPKTWKQIQSSARNTLKRLKEIMTLHLASLIKVHTTAAAHKPGLQKAFCKFPGFFCRSMVMSQCTQVRAVSGVLARRFPSVFCSSRVMLQCILSWAWYSMVLNDGVKKHLMAALRSTAHGNMMRCNAVQQTAQMKIITFMHTTGVGWGDYPS